MLLKTTINGKEKWIYPTSNWKKLELTSAGTSFLIDENFYVFTKKVN